MGGFDRFIFLSLEPLYLVVSEPALCRTKFFGAKLTPPSLHGEY